MYSRASSSDTPVFQPDGARCSRFPAIKRSMSREDTLFVFLSERCAVLDGNGIDHQDGMGTGWYLMVGDKKAPFLDSVPSPSRAQQLPPVGNSAPLIPSAVASQHLE